MSSFANGADFLLQATATSVTRFVASIAQLMFCEKLFLILKGFVFVLLAIIEIMSASVITKRTTEFQAVFFSAGLRDVGRDSVSFPFVFVHLT